MTDVTLEAQAWTDVEPDVQALLDKWLVAKGERVAAGQPLANVVLVKSNQEILSPASGTVDDILVPAGETFARGQPIARLKDAP